MLLVGIGLGLGLQLGAGISILRVLPAVRLIATILRHQAALSEVCALLSTASAFSSKKAKPIFSKFCHRKTSILPEQVRRSGVLKVPPPD